MRDSSGAGTGNAPGISGKRMRPADCAAGPPPDAHAAVSTAAASTTTKKELNARKVHAAHLPSHEYVLALYDELLALGQVVVLLAGVCQCPLAVLQPVLRVRLDRGRDVGGAPAWGHRNL